MDGPIPEPGLIGICGQGSTHVTWYDYISRFRLTADDVLGAMGHLVADNCQSKSAVGQKNAQGTSTMTVATAALLARDIVRPGEFAFLCTKKGRVDVDAVAADVNLNAFRLGGRTVSVFSTPGSPYDVADASVPMPSREGSSFLDEAEYYELHQLLYMADEFAAFLRWGSDNPGMLLCSELTARKIRVLQASMSRPYRRDVRKLMAAMGNPLIDRTVASTEFTTTVTGDECHRREGLLAWMERVAAARERRFKSEGSLTGDHTDLDVAADVELLADVESLAVGADALGDRLDDSPEQTNPLAGWSKDRLEHRQLSAALDEIDRQMSELSADPVNFGAAAASDAAASNDAEPGADFFDRFQADALLAETLLASDRPDDHVQADTIMSALLEPTADAEGGVALDPGPVSPDTTDPDAPVRGMPADVRRVLYSIEDRSRMTGDWKFYKMVERLLEAVMKAGTVDNPHSQMAVARFVSVFNSLHRKGGGFHFDGADINADFRVYFAPLLSQVAAATSQKALDPAKVMDNLQRCRNLLLETATARARVLYITFLESLSCPDLDAMVDGDGNLRLGLFAAALAAHTRSARPGPAPAVIGAAPSAAPSAAFGPSGLMWVIERFVRVMPLPGAPGHTWIRARFKNLGPDQDWMYTRDQLLQDGDFTDNEVSQCIANMAERDPVTVARDDNLPLLPGFDAPSACTAASSGAQPAPSAPPVAMWVASGGSDRQWQLMCSCTKMYKGSRKRNGPPGTRAMVDHQISKHPGPVGVRNLKVISDGPPDIAPAPVLDAGTGAVDNGAVYDFFGPQLLDLAGSAAEGREARRAGEPDYFVARSRVSMSKFAAMGQLQYLEFCVDLIANKTWVDSEYERFISIVMPYVRLVEGNVDFDELIEVINKTIKGLGLRGKDDIVTHGQRAERLARLKRLAESLDNRRRHAKSSTLRSKDETMWRMMLSMFFSGTCEDRGHTTLSVDLMGATVKVTLRNALLMCCSGATLTGHGPTGWTFTIVRCHLAPNGDTLADVEGRPADGSAAVRSVVSTAGWDLSAALSAANPAIQEVTRAAAALVQTENSLEATAAAQAVLAGHSTPAPASVGNRGGGNVKETAHLVIGDANKHSVPSTGAVSWLPPVFNNRVRLVLTGSMPSSDDKAKAAGVRTTAKSQRAQDAGGVNTVLPKAVHADTLRHVGGTTQAHQTVKNPAAHKMRPAGTVCGVLERGWDTLTKGQFNAKIAARFRERHAVEDRLAATVEASRKRQRTKGGSFPAAPATAQTLATLAEPGSDLAAVLDLNESFLEVTRQIDDSTRAGAHDDDIDLLYVRLDGLIDRMTNDDAGYADALLGAGLDQVCRDTGHSVSVDLGAPEAGTSAATPFEDAGGPDCGDDDAGVSTDDSNDSDFEAQFSPLPTDQPCS